MSEAPATTTTPPVLELEGIHTYYGAIHALKGVTLEVREGEIVTLLGANGAGKSSTLRSINGLNHPRRGRIRFRGEDITFDPPHDIVARGVAQSPEGRKLFPRMTVLENLEMGAFQPIAAWRRQATARGSTRPGSRNSPRTICATASPRI